MTNLFGYIYLLLAVIFGITSNGFLKTTNGFTNLVPTILINAPRNVAHLKPGKLADVAPTILDLMSIPKPKIMTGSSLLSLNGGI